MSTTEKIQDMKTELIYAQAQIEGIDINYADVEHVLVTGKISYLAQKQTDAVIGLNEAWQYLFEHAENENISFDLLAHYNELIGYGNTFLYPGEIRPPKSVHVADWTPEDITDDTYEKIINQAYQYKNMDERACVLVLLLARAQMFHNGNKRTAQMFANHYLAYENAGIAFYLSDETKRNYFLENLYDYYTGAFPLDDFLKVLKLIAIVEL